MSSHIGNGYPYDAEYLYLPFWPGGLPRTLNKEEVLGPAVGFKIAVEAFEKPLFAPQRSPARLKSCPSRSFMWALSHGPGIR